MIVGQAALSMEGNGPQPSWKETTGWSGRKTLLAISMHSHARARTYTREHVCAHVCANTHTHTFHKQIYSFHILLCLGEIVISWGEGAVSMPWPFSLCGWIHWQLKSHRLPSPVWLRPGSGYRVVSRAFKSLPLSGLTSDSRPRVSATWNFRNQPALVLPVSNGRYPPGRQEDK